MKQARNPASVHPPLANYSHQIELSGGLALDNVLRNLDESGMGAADLVKLVFYLTEEVDSGRRGAILADRLDGHAPAMTLLYVAGLASPTLKVEIDAWASAA